MDGEENVNGHCERLLREEVRVSNVELLSAPAPNKSTIVVKLFNAIQQTQTATVAAQEEAKSNKGSGKPYLPAPSWDHKTKKKMPQPTVANSKSGQTTLLCVNYLANRPFLELNQDTFLQMIKSGGVVSRT